MNIKGSITDYLKVGELKENLTNIIEAKLELKKLDVLDKIEEKIAGLVTKIIIGVFLLIAFIMLNIIIAITLNGLLESQWLGYGIIFLIYCLIALIININKEKVETTIKIKIGEEIDKAL